MGQAFQHDIAVVGGCGHVGLPLGIVFAAAGQRVLLYDTNAEAVELVSNGKMPFDEPGAQELLEELAGHGLQATTDPAAISAAEHIIVVIGTPVDEHLNPDPTVVADAIEELSEYLVKDQMIVLRSTIYPGSTAVVEKMLHRLGVEAEVAFCPERIAEGKAIAELRELPQIVSARTETAFLRAEELFGHITKQTVRLAPEEAELAKLFTNTWRYIKFATANQLFMMANDFGLDYERIRVALSYDYPRAADLPRAGFAAGPCLLKDTMQLAAFNNNNFLLGHTAMMINEGLPLYVLSRLERRYQLAEMTVGILGMAFKEDSDDIRSSLSYKLKRILRFKAKSVLCTDPYVHIDESLVSLERVVEEADLLIVGAPHTVYRNLSVDIPVVDIWGMDGRGVTV